MKRTKVPAALALVASCLIGASAPGAVAQPRSTPPAPTISATVSPTKPVTLESSTVSGKVTPANATPTVFLQRKIGSTWYDRGSAPVDRTTGAYRIAMRPSQTGTYSLRVRSAGGGVLSRTISIQVWAGKRVFSGTGNFTSSRIAFTGGRYNVVAAYSAASCQYEGRLNGIPGDIRTNFTIGHIRGGTTSKIDESIPQGNYTFVMKTGPTCPWSATFYRY